MPTLDEVDTLPSAAELFQHHAEVKRLVVKLNADKRGRRCKIQSSKPSKPPDTRGNNRCSFLLRCTQDALKKEKSGTPRRTRTFNQLIKSQLLYH